MVHGPSYTIVVSNVRRNHSKREKKNKRKERCGYLRSVSQVILACYLHLGNGTGRCINLFNGNNSCFAYVGHGKT